MDDKENASRNKPDVGFFIEVVQTYEHLYNLRHKDYKNNNKKEESWQEIAQIVNMSVDECKKQWRNIRDKYMREKREKPSGSATPESTWEFLKKMSFYEKFSNPRKTSTATPRLAGSSSSQSASTFKWKSMEVILPQESPLSPQDEDEVDSHTSGAETQEPRSSSVTPSVKRGEKKRMDDISSILAVANKLAESIQTKAPLTQNEAFTNYILSRLNEMTPEEATTKRKEIMRVLEDL